jgi:hypothetical protein
MPSHHERIGWRRPRVVALFASAVCLVVLSMPGHAMAAAVPLAINTLTPELEAAKGAGASTLELSFINLTAGPALLEAQVVGQPECKPSLSEDQLQPNQITAVTIELLPGSCDQAAGLKLEATATLTDGASQRFEIAPKGAPATTPNWHELWAFSVTLLVGLGLSAAVFLRWAKPKRRELFRWKVLKSKLSESLGSLDATWNFNDNWATNATAAGALLTGLFSATTAKAFLGSNAEALTALATVGAAIALACVSAAPIVALATKSYAVKSEARSDSFTVGGVLLAAALILAGAAGQLWLIAYNASKLGLGSAGWLVWIAFALAVGLLLIYSWRTLEDTLERGTGAAAPAGPKEEIEAATLIAKAIEAAASEGRKGQAFSDLNRRFDAGTTGRRGYRGRTRSALI